MQTIGTPPQQQTPPPYPQRQQMSHVPQQSQQQQTPLQQPQLLAQQQQQTLNVQHQLHLNQLKSQANANAGATNDFRYGQSQNILSRNSFDGANGTTTWTATTQQQQQQNVAIAGPPQTIAAQVTTATANQAAPGAFSQSGGSLPMVCFDTCAYLLIFIIRIKCVRTYVTVFSILFLTVFFHL